MKDLHHYIPSLFSKKRKLSDHRIPSQEEIGETRDTNIITKQIQSAIEYESLVLLYMEDQEIVYSTRFFQEQKTGSTDSVILEPIRPPIGNLRIRKTTYCTLHFFTEFHLIENVVVKFLEILSSQCIRCTFPEQITLSFQRRGDIRVPVPVSEDLYAIVDRPAGFPFEAKIHDISAGGCSFYTIEPIAKLSEQTEVELALRKPGWREHSVTGKILGESMENGKKCYRVRFGPISNRSKRRVEEIVAFLQRQSLKNASKSPHNQEELSTS